MTEEEKSKIHIYTGYFSALGKEAWRAVNISNYQPIWFRPKLPDFPPLFPSWKMVTDYKYGRISAEQYEAMYRERYLAFLDPEDIARKFNDKILTCHEGFEDKARTVPKFCHRHVVARWLREAGIRCDEIEPRPKRPRSI